MNAGASRARSNLAREREPILGGRPCWLAAVVLSRQSGDVCACLARLLRSHCRTRRHRRRVRRLAYTTATVRQRPDNTSVPVRSPARHVKSNMSKVEQFSQQYRDQLREPVGGRGPGGRDSRE